MKYFLFSIWITTLFVGLQKASAEEPSTAMELLCKTKNIASDLDPSAYARINEIQEQGITDSDKDEEQIFCVLKDGNGVKKSLALLEIVVEEDPPATLSLEVPNLFLPELQSLTLECSYGDIGPRNRLIDNLPIELDPIGEDWTYYCGEAEHALELVFTGVYREKPTMSKNRKKRLRSKDSPVACVTFSEKGPEYRRPTEDEGHSCNVTKKKTGRLMYNETGEFSCFMCCKQHHWSKSELQCKKCPECTTRKMDNVFTSCNYTGCEVTTSEPPAVEPKPDTVTTFPLSSISKGPNAPETSSVTTKAPPTAEDVEQPADAPAEVFLVEVSTSHAYISWTKIPSTPTRPVTHYQISLKNDETKEKKHFKTNGSTNYFNFTSLSPHSCYDVNIQGIYRAGEGPLSSNLEIHTLLDVPSVEITDVQGIENQAHITWEPKSSDLHLTVMAVQISPTGEELSTVSASDAAGELTFPLSEEGMYHILLYYMARFRRGPMSNIYLAKTTCTHETCTPVVLVILWTVIAIVVIFAVSFFVRLFWIHILRPYCTRSSSAI